MIFSRKSSRNKRKEREVQAIATDPRLTVLRKSAEMILVLAVPERNTRSAVLEKINHIAHKSYRLLLWKRLILNINQSKTSVLPCHSLHSIASGVVSPVTPLE